MDGIAEMPAGRAAWLKDPEDNLIGMIELHERRDSPAPRPPAMSTLFVTEMPAPAALAPQAAMG